MAADMGLSRRGAGNVDAILPRISAAVAERAKKGNSNIDLGTSENWLIRRELIELTKSAINDGLVEQHLSYPTGFAGDSELLDALAKFFNAYFNPHIPVEATHLATAPGAASSLDALLYNICEPGDGVLVPGPYWNGFDWLFNVRSGVQPVLVNVDSFEATLTSALIPAMVKAMDESTRPIKGVVFTNPHNPFGQCYPRSTIEQCIKFCYQRGIHFISDEVYALSKFDSPDLSEPVPFTSALALDVEALGCDLSHVHTIWSISKDLGSSGFRMGCAVTQKNQALAVGMALASNTQMSSLTAISTAALLSSPQLPGLLELNSTRLSEAYATMTTFLKRHNIEYIPVSYGLFVFARIAPNANTWEDEVAAIAACKEAGVVVSSGKGYHVVEKEKGWARLTFAIKRDLLDEALRRLAIGLELSEATLTNGVHHA